MCVGTPESIVDDTIVIDYFHQKPINFFTLMTLLQILY
jgi:hypothetical protein